jgi:hypothetical protein
MPPTMNDVLFAGGTPNIPGTSLEILYAQFDDIDLATFPELPAVKATDSDYTTIATDFTMQVGKVFSKLSVSVKTGQITAEKVGPYDSENYVSKFECEHPGIGDEIEAFLQKAANNNLVVIVTELDGTVRQFGSKNRPCRIEAVAIDHGKDSGDEGRKQVITFEWFGPGKAPKFTGVAPLV